MEDLDDCHINRPNTVPVHPPAPCVCNPHSAVSLSTICGHQPKVHVCPAGRCDTVKTLVVPLSVTTLIPHQRPGCCWCHHCQVTKQQLLVMQTCPACNLILTAIIYPLPILYQEAGHMTIPLLREELCQKAAQITLTTLPEASQVLGLRTKSPSWSRVRK